jgi:DNA-cytosine methyltransferase
MKVLSLFDGMACGRIALEQLGIPVEKYYASEIDKYAIQVAQANYPDIIQVGDVCDLDPKDYMDVDLIQGGSPCQGFSMAGKQLAFDDPRSALFFEFIRLLKAIKPKYFLLENVKMKKEFLQIISEQVSECYPEIPFGIEPIFINSSLLSAQSRQRYYWTNIPGIKQPEDRGIVLKDILEDNFESDRDKSYCIDANYSKTGAKPHHYKDKYRRQLVNKPIKVGMNVEEVKIRKHEVDEKALQKLLRSAKKESKKTMKDIAKECNVALTKAEHWFRTDSSFAIPKDTVWIKLKFVLGITTNKFDKALLEFEYRDGVFESTQRVYSDQGKSPTLTASNKEQMIETKPKMVGRDNTPGHDILKRVYSEDGKSPTITAHAGKGTVPKVETRPKQVGIAHHKNGKPLPSWGGTNKVYGQHGKSPTIMAAAGMGGNREPKVETKPKQVGVAVDIKGHDQIKRVYSPEGKSPTVTTCGGGHREPKVVTGGAFRGRAYDKDGKRMDKDGVSVANKTKQMLELRKDAKSNAITTVGKDSVVAHEDLTWRKLTPLECERLQTVPDNYTNHVSNTQRYKMLGNGWTVEVIKHIYNHIQ